MARFNPETSSVTNNGWINASQGQTPNKALGYLFGGIADVITSVQKTKEEQQKKALASDVDKGVGGILNESLGEDIPDTLLPKVSEEATAGPNRGLGPVARELSDAEKKIARFKMAMEQGKTSDAAYNLQLITLSKNLRIKYPQYETEIDALIQRASGASPANDLRRELNALTVQTGSKSYDFLKGNEEFLNPSSPQAQIYKAQTGVDFNPENYDLNAARYSLGVVKTRENELKMLNEEATLKDKQNKLTAEEAEDKAITIAGRLREDIFFSTVSGTGGPTERLSWEQLKKTVDRANADNLITPDEKQAIEVMSNSLELQLKMVAGDLINGMHGEDGFNFSKYLDDAGKKRVEETLLQPFRDMKDSLINGDFGTLGAVARNLESQKKFHELKSLSSPDYNFMQRVEEAKKIWGSTSVEEAMRYASANPDMQKASPEARAMYEMIVVSLKSNKTLGELLTDKTLMKDLAKVEGGSTAVLEAVEMNIHALADPTTPAKEVAKTAEELFSEKEFHLIEPFIRSDPKKYFDIVTDPNLLAKLKGTPAEEKAKKFGFKMAEKVLSPLSTEMVNSYSFTDIGSILTYDTGTHRFVLSPPTSQDVWNMRGKEAPSATWGRLNANVNRMNSYLDRMSPLFTNPSEADELLMDVFNGVDYKNLQKEGSLFTRMKEIFQNKLQEGMEGVQEELQQKGPEKFHPGTPPVETLPQDQQGSLEDVGQDAILSFVSSAEGADYTTMFGGSQIELADYTVGEVQTIQRLHGKRTGSSATGAYQIMRKTLAGLIKKGVVDPGEKFTPEVQDRLAKELLKGRGYSKWIKGTLSTEDFADSLAKEWASLPTGSGKSYYHGDKMGNKASVRRNRLIQYLEAIKDSIT